MISANFDRLLTLSAIAHGPVPDIESAFKKRDLQQLTRDANEIIKNKRKSVCIKDDWTLLDQLSHRDIDWARSSPARKKHLLQALYVLRDTYILLAKAQSSVLLSSTTEFDPIKLICDEGKLKTPAAIVEGINSEKFKKANLTPEFRNLCGDYAEKYSNFKTIPTLGDFKDSGRTDMERLFIFTSYFWNFISCAIGMAFFYYSRDNSIDINRIIGYFEKQVAGIKPMLVANKKWISQVFLVCCTIGALFNIFKMNAFAKKTL